MKIVEFKHFCYYYKTKKDYVKALNDVNFDVNQGELLVVVGESGSGKSTLLKSIVGQCSYMEGELYVEGLPIEQLDVSKGNFSLVQQEIALYPHLTVFDNIAFSLKNMGADMFECESRVVDLAKKMDIDWLLTRKPRQLSLGQCQRVALARAMIKNPSIVLMDEPFANLDNATKAEMRVLVKTLHRQFQSTIIFVTHNLDEAFALGERIVALEKGNVVEQGSPSQLRDNPQSSLLKGYCK